MTKKQTTQKKLNLTPTVRHLAGNAPFRPGTVQITNGRLPTGRMSFGPLTPKRLMSYESVAWFIRTYNPKNMAFYLDTNFFTGEEKPWALWKSLLDKQIVITPLVWQELKPWLESPFRNRRMRDIVLDARLSKNPAIRFDPAHDWHPFQKLACDYYIDLLAVRKRMGRALADDFLVEHGREPTAEEFNRLIQSAGADHEFHLMRKGRTEIEKENFFADEQLVASAACDAIINRRESTILTTDNDLQEQFVRMMSLLDWQYQSMLFADRFAANPSSFTTQKLRRTTPELQHYFAEDGLLVRKPCEPGREFVEWLLPERFTPTAVYCLLFGGSEENRVFSPLTFHADSDLVQLLEMKGKTGGMNTDRLQGRNCHVTGLPVGIIEPRRWVAVAKDNVLEVGMMRYSLTDIAHANIKSGARV